MNYLCSGCGRDEAELPPEVNPADIFEFSANGSMYCYSCMDEYVDYLEEHDVPEDDGTGGLFSVDEIEWMIVNNMDWNGDKLV